MENCKNCKALKDFLDWALRRIEKTGFEKLSDYEKFIYKAAKDIAEMI